MARSAPASDRDSSRPMIPCRKQQLRPDTPNLQAVPPRRVGARRPDRRRHAGGGFLGDDEHQQEAWAGRVQIVMRREAGTGMVQIRVTLETRKPLSGAALAKSSMIRK